MAALAIVQALDCSKRKCSVTYIVQPNNNTDYSACCPKCLVGPE